jgi:signal transduction histidine kinase
MRGMRGRWTRALAVAAAMVGIVLGGQLILSTTPYELWHTITPSERLNGVLVEGVWVIATVTLMVRQPASDLWKIILLSTAAGQTWLLGYLPIEPHLLIDLPSYLVGDVWAAVFIHLVLAYPTGRLGDRFDRRYVPFVYAFAIGFRVIAMIVQPEDCSPLCNDPIRFLPSEASWDVVRYTGLAFVPVLMTISLVELWRHWRLAGPGGRRAIAPMLIAAPISFISIFSGYFADAFLDAAAQDATHTWNVLGFVQALTIPVALIVGAMQSRLARGNVADLAVQLGRGVPVGGLQPVLARALRDPSLLLAFPAPGGDGLVDASGQPVNEMAASGRTVTRVERDGELLAVLIDDPAAIDEDPGLAEAVGSVARLALENERLAAQVRAQLDEVRASRQRIVDAADAERRRVERDLHDGAQQRLVALAMRLDLARQTDGASAALLDDATAELRAAVAEVRDLARGLHPPILTEAGLGPAIEALAERSAIPVTVDAPSRRYPATVEAAAYFVVNEAITNATKYARASGVTVTIRDKGGRLAISVRDDGHGGADPTGGSGLRGLMDRVAALGGSLSVDSPAGGGTTILAELPVPA